MKKCQVCRIQREENMIDLRESYNFVLPIVPKSSLLNKEDMWMCQECYENFCQTLEKVSKEIGLKKYSDLRKRMK